MTPRIASEAQIAVLLDVELIELLDEMARERGMSRSAFLRRILHEHLGIERGDDEPQLELDLEGLDAADILLARTGRYRWLKLALIEMHPEISSVLEMKCPYCGRRFRARRYMARHIARGRGPCPRIYSTKIEEVKKIYREFISTMRHEVTYRGEERVELYIVPNPRCRSMNRCGEKVFKDLDKALKYFISRKKVKRRPGRKSSKNNAIEYLHLD